MKYVLSERQLNISCLCFVTYETLHKVLIYKNEIRNLYHKCNYQFVSNEYTVSEQIFKIHW